MNYIKIIILVAVALIIGNALFYFFFYPAAKVNLYYYNQIRDKEIAEFIPCSPDAVLPVERKIRSSQNIVEETINLLLEGNINDQEKVLGFTSEFPLQGLKLSGSELKDGVLTLEFNDPLNKTSGGSCRIRLLWSQIQKTALQFPEVQEVKFLPEELFQP